MGVTIREVAKEAGVSPSTVSRVIANSPKISDETKGRVEIAIKKLNYHPNAIARSLANKSTKTIGIVLPNEAEDLFKNPFFVQAMTGISIYAQKKGYYIMYTFSKNEDEEVDFIKNFTSTNLVDGVILLIARSKDKCIDFLEEMEYPFVVIGRPEETKGALWVDNDNFQAMYKVVSKLFAYGHKQIAYIGGTSEWNVSKDRLNGYKQAHMINGAQFDESLILEMEDFTEEYGYKAAEKLLKSSEPTAIVTTDDLLAFGVNKYFKENNIDNIALVGFNNIPLAEYQTPPLASVDINAQNLGYHAAKLLIDKLNNEEGMSSHYIIDTNLIERESIKVK